MDKHGDRGTNLRQMKKTNAGWIKYAYNPVCGGSLGTCFDLSALKEGDIYRMWFSWRPRKSIALIESKDGIHWSEPVIALEPNALSGWETNMNRPVVIKRGEVYHMWYTSQFETSPGQGKSYIGHAVSQNGVTWIRTSDQPVLIPVQPWEKVAVMCPHVIWDEEAGIYRMWYSGGEQYEPDALGYAVSTDGQHWTKHPDNPIFVADHTHAWESYKVAACQVIRHEGWYFMFYVGFANIDHACIGIARSRDGITQWQRHPANPVLGPGDEQSWDHDATYKPYAIYEQDRWLLWYNGRRGALEQIGLAFHDGDDLRFV